MSEYKWSDPDSWDTFCYVKKGEEKLGFFQTYLELETLERQLAEAREEVEMLKDIKERMFEMLNLAYCNHDGFKPLFESLCKMIKEQLKEQG